MSKLSGEQRGQLAVQIIAHGFVLQQHLVASARQLDQRAVWPARHAFADGLHMHDLFIRAQKREAGDVR